MGACPLSVCPTPSQCAGLLDFPAPCPAVVAAAARVTRQCGGASKPPRGLSFFWPGNFAEVAHYLVLAKSCWFVADGAGHVVAVAAGVTWLQPSQ
jgi:hypothetical protein